MKNFSPCGRPWRIVLWIDKLWRERNGAARLDEPMCVQPMRKHGYELDSMTTTTHPDERWDNIVQSYPFSLWKDSARTSHEFALSLAPVDWVYWSQAVFPRMLAFYIAWSDKGTSRSRQLRGIHFSHQFDENSILTLLFVRSNLRLEMTCTTGRSRSNSGKDISVAVSSLTLVFLVRAGANLHAVLTFIAVTKLLPQLYPLWFL